MSFKKLKRDELLKMIYILSGTLDRIQSELALTAASKYKGFNKSVIHKKNESYPFIPFTSRIAASQIIKARDILSPTVYSNSNTYRAYSFLDAGCGIGNVMLLASKAGFNVYGLEIDPTLIAFSKKLNIYNTRIIKQNILTYKDYRKYDVIYFYRPIESGPKQVKFEIRVKDQMKLGAILIPNYMLDRNITTDTRFKKILVEQGSYIYQKVKE